jgi:hypothetical protein
MTKTELLADLERLRRDHHVNEEDQWYSCPLSGWCADATTHHCNCGAEQHNIVLNAIMARVKEAAWD